MSGSQAVSRRFREVCRRGATKACQDHCAVRNGPPRTWSIPVLEVPMRTFPGLFVGRRTVLQAQEVSGEAKQGTIYRCGACEELILIDLDFVVCYRQILAHALLLQP